MGRNCARGWILFAEIVMSVHSISQWQLLQGGYWFNCPEFPLHLGGGLGKHSLPVVRIQCAQPQVLRVSGMTRHLCDPSDPRTYHRGCSI